MCIAITRMVPLSFWKVDKVSYRVFSENYLPLKEIVATPRRDDILEEKWVAILQNGYAPLLVLRQYRSRQFIRNQTHWMKRLAVGPMMTPEYSEWWVRRINDNIPEPS
ncbi:hypothetical protein Godav_021828 [Gossypium davidsonii]|uniref:Uncharacterized protein n=1 Tax=Gossypium davidsonii TaxID=34287 RepID=A0A7J8TBD0_GOSDV|nr:hypothetical protein [Gossypium davidsonii]